MSVTVTVTITNKIQIQVTVARKSHRRSQSCDDLAAWFGDIRTLLENGVIKQND